MNNVKAAGDVTLCVCCKCGQPPSGIANYLNLVVEADGPVARVRAYCDDCSQRIVTLMEGWAPCRGCGKKPQGKGERASFRTYVLRVAGVLSGEDEITLCPPCQEKFL